MAKCRLTGKKQMSGNLVSHSNRKTRTVRKANIRKKRIVGPDGKIITTHLSARALRTVSRKGWKAFKQ